LTAGEGLERYLHTRYVGQKRFSLEGGETLIPVLDNLLQRAGAGGVQELVIGMAHRGRLNVLVNTLGKVPKDLFSEFEGKNGDDPEACVMAIEIAMDYRKQFKKDVVVDIVCFRKLGHNEQDEPMVTQPLMYKIINAHPGTRKLYADRLASQGVIAADEGDKLVATFRQAMDAGYHTNKTILANFKPPFAVDWSKYKGTKWNENDDTTLPLADLQMLA